MPDPTAATETQLRNIEAATGVAMPAFAAAVAEQKLQRHTQIVEFLQARYALTYGHANAVAHKVRELSAGGPPPPDALLDAQYTGAKAALRPIYERLAEFAIALGPDVQVLVQKSGVAFRRRKQFALVQAASAKRVQLGLNLASTPADPRVVPTTGMCSHRVDIATVQGVDDDVLGWLRSAYQDAG